MVPKFVMNVLMLGWELPPFNSGGLGVACLGLTKALSQKGVKIRFVLPHKQEIELDCCDLLFANIKNYEDLVRSYTTSGKSYEEVLAAGHDYVNQALLFAERVRAMALKFHSDVIHSNDWLTFPAGVAAKEATNKPLIAHVHSTEIDRTGGHFPNPVVYKIEREGLQKADKIISVSEFTKNIIVRDYGINSAKVDVVHNGVDRFHKKDLPPALTSLKDLGYKFVLYLGRISLQKGPEYFIRAAKTVLEYEPKTVFVVVGSGDMQERMMNEAASLGIMENVMFTGFLRGDEKDRLWQAADLYVMPSVSEPFGITPLESIANGTPALISKQSGVSEVLNHVLKVDFWDTDEMANKIVSVLRHPPLKQDLSWESGKELPNINWDAAAAKCLRVYDQLV